MNDKITLLLRGKEITLEGFADGEFISVNRDSEQLWHKFLGTKDGKYLVDCTDDNWDTSWLVTFTKEVYDKHIKDLKPSVKSPFSFNKVDP